MSDRQVLWHVSAEALAASAAARLVTRLVERQAATGGAHLVLTGGGIGTKVLAAIAQTPGRDAVDWSALDIWWGDERFLPSGDPDRNETGARQVLLDLVGVDPARIHPIPGPDQARDAQEAARAYASLLAEASRPEDHGSVPAFDVLLLGIGPEGHVASIFPESPAAHEQQRAVVGVAGCPKPPPTRVTMTLPAINAARQVWILASGEAKARAVRLTLEAGAGPLQVPAAGVRGRDQTLLLVDQAAASLLPSDLVRPEAEPPARAAA